MFTDDPKNLFASAPVNKGLTKSKSTSDKSSEKLGGGVLAGGAAGRGGQSGRRVIWKRAGKAGGGAVSRTKRLD